MKFCIKSETTFERRRREKKGKILAKTLITSVQNGACPYKKFWQKNTTNPREQSFSNPLKPYSHQEYKKKHAARGPRVATHSLCCTDVIARSWKYTTDDIYRARAQGGRFFARILFVFFARVSVGLKTTLWVCGTLLPKKTRFSKKKSKNLIGCHPLSRSFSLLLLGDLTANNNP